MSKVQVAGVSMVKFAKPGKHTAYREASRRSRRIPGRDDAECGALAFRRVCGTLDSSYYCVSKRSFTGATGAASTLIWFGFGAGRARLAIPLH